MTHQAWKLDSAGDFVTTTDAFGNKDIEMVVDEQYVAQSARVRLLTSRGSYPLNPAFGFPRGRVQSIFNKPFIDGSIRRTLGEDPDIEDVEVLGSDLDGRTRSIDIALRITASDGSEVTLEGGIA